MPIKTFDQMSPGLIRWGRPAGVVPSPRPGGQAVKVLMSLKSEPIVPSRAEPTAYELAKLAVTVLQANRDRHGYSEQDALKDALAFWLNASELLEKYRAAPANVFPDPSERFRLTVTSRIEGRYPLAAAVADQPATLPSGIAPLAVGYAPAMLVG